MLGMHAIQAPPDNAVAVLSTVTVHAVPITDEMVTIYIMWITGISIVSTVTRISSLSSLGLRRMSNYRICSNISGILSLAHLLEKFGRLCYLVHTCCQLLTHCK